MGTFRIDPRAVSGALAALILIVSVPSAAWAQASSGQTPRLSNGKPDLSGMWRVVDTSGGLGQFTNRVEDDGDVVRLFPSRRCAPNQVGCRDNTNQANDYELTFRYDPNRPRYKPEHWDKVQFLDYDTNFSDPMMRCVPLGIPRVGPPTKILQSADEVVMLYAGRDHDYRIVPTDGRAPNPDAFPSFWGEGVGRWDGDTLVVESSNFTDQTWIASGISGGGGGYFHSFEMRVTERFRREGNVLHYELTVADPEVLIEPWEMNPFELRLETNRRATIPEGLPCREIDSEVAVSRIRH